MSTSAEHAAEAARLLRSAMDTSLTDPYVLADHEGTLAAAQVHATLAQVQYLREIADRFPEIPTEPVEEETPLYNAAALLVGLAEADPGAEEFDIALVVLWRSHQPAAQSIAREATERANRLASFYPEKVAAAIRTLGITMEAVV